MANNHNGIEKPFDLQKIIAIVKKNWMVLKGDKLRLVPLFMFPLLMVTIFGFTAGATPKHISAAMVDYDNSELSRLVQSKLYSTDLFSIQKVVSSQDEGRKMIDYGEIKILLIIPSGFEKDVNDGKTAHISVIVDASDPTVAQITKASTTLFIQGLSQQLLKSKIDALTISAQNIDAEINIIGQQLDTVGKSQGAVASQSAIDSEFRATQLFSKQTNADITSKIQSIGHGLSSVSFDPNQISQAYGTGNVIHLTSAYDIMTASDRESYLRQQIAVHQGFQAVTGRLASDNAKLYSDAKNVESAYTSEKISVLSSSQSVSKVGAQLDQLVTDSKKIPIEVVSVTDIEPYGTGRRGLDFLLPNILALVVFQGAVMGLGRAVAGERKDGSLTRVFLTPTSNITIISGTQLFYMLLETIRSYLIVFAAAVMFGVLIKGSLVDVIAIICIYALGATGVGMVLSVLAKSQEQYMALGMLISLPMMFLGGVFFPIQTMPPALQGLTRVLPLTYAADALRGVMIKGFTLSQVIPDLLFLGLFGFIMVVLSILIFKRELI